MHHLRNVSVSKGFALPTVLIASIVLLTILAVSVSATAAVRTTLKDQYYAQLAQIAGEAGVAYAKACLEANGNVPLWTDAKPLKPNTDCSGNELLSGSTVRALVIAGGGGGGGAGSGGGAGGVVYNESLSITATNYSVTVGGGGAGGVGAAAGTNGSNSTFSTLTAIGGGRGVTHGTTTAGITGGSGGGGAIVTGGAAPAGGAGTPDQGAAGGAGFVQSGWTGTSGGGGGAGGVGSAGSGVSGGGNGGPGISNAITGASVMYAGGGGAGEINGSFVGTGGTGGGGSGVLNAAGTNGQANTGSGGGGGSYNGSYLNGGAGGSGVVVIAYPANAGITATGGTITTAGLYKVHTFTGNGTFAVSAVGTEACPSSPRCSVTTNGNVRSSFSVPRPTLDAEGKAVTIANTGYVEILRTSNGSVWRTYNQPSVQAAVVPDLCSGETSGPQGWSNAVAASTQDALGASLAAQTITLANANLNAGHIFYRKDFAVSQAGTYTVSLFTPSGQDYAEAFLDGQNWLLSNGSQASRSVTLAPGCHSIVVRVTNLTIEPRTSRLTAAVTKDGANVTVSDPSWRVTTGNAVHYSSVNYDADPSRWTVAREISTATGLTNHSVKNISTTHSFSGANYPGPQYAYFRDGRTVTVDTDTQVQVGFRCDDQCAVYLDGEILGTNNWSAAAANVTFTLKAGSHKFGVRLYNQASGASAFYLFVTRTSDGYGLTQTDTLWTAANAWTAGAEEYYSYDRTFNPSPNAIITNSGRVLAVGGGGGGGGTIGGGGGGGGVVYDPAYNFTVGSYPVVVGAGGTGGVGWDFQPSAGAYGENSSFGTVVALGGGGGAGHTTQPRSGGSGGGGANTYTNGAFGVLGQGNRGGTGNTNDGGGGGGAGAAGTNLGAGGTGLTFSSSIAGTTLALGSGGGGGARNGVGTANAGGSGAGTGGTLSTTPATSGTANRGGGGGGGGYNDVSTSARVGGNGGSGLVAISYLTGSMTATGGTISTSGGYTIHRFTSSGTFTVTSIP